MEEISLRKRRGRGRVDSEIKNLKEDATPPSPTPLLIPSIKSTCWGQELTAMSVSGCIICCGEKQIGAEPSGLPHSLGKCQSVSSKAGGGLFIGARCRCEWPACVDACKVWA